MTNSLNNKPVFYISEMVQFYFLVLVANEMSNSLIASLEILCKTMKDFFDLNFLMLSMSNVLYLEIY